MYIIYIYDKNKNLLTQFFEISNLQITEKLNDVSTAIFHIENKKEKIRYFSKEPASFFDLNNQIFKQNEGKKLNSFLVSKEKILVKDLAKYQYLKESNIVDIYKIDQNGNEKRLFYGLIKGVKSDLQTCEVRCVDFIYLLKKKCIFSNINGVFSAKEILNNIKTQINNRDNNFIKTINCEINDQTNRDFKRGKTIFDILRDLASDLYEFKFIDGNLFFVDSIGEDRTSGSNIVFFEYNIFSPESANISKAEIEYDLDNIFNYVYGSDEIGFDSESVEIFGVLEKFDDKNKKEKLLQENKNSLKEFKIEPIISDFFFCNVGDTVKVSIDNGTEMLKFDGSLKVVEKSYKSGDLEVVTFKLNSSKFRSKNIFETISELKSDVKNLKL
ncbi:hypothetical protein DLH72_02220 [Candidatus Gracilibacteria bacterium]|nr:MAG: hypothetical protein DLH72_02220 [Candidatus Gracilibacteria bacterium]